MFEFLLVGVGGACGAMARYGVSRLVALSPTSAQFPFATMLVNLSGCFLIGLLLGPGESQLGRPVLTTGIKLLLITGFLGGFTTFSAFGFETFDLIRREQIVSAGANVLLSVSLSLFGVWLGVAANQRLGIFPDNLG